MKHHLPIVGPWRLINMELSIFKDLKYELPSFGLTLSFSHLNDNDFIKVKIEDSNIDKENSTEVFIVFPVYNVSPRIKKSSIVNVIDRTDEVIGHLVTFDSTIQDLLSQPSLITTSLLVSFLLSESFDEDIQNDENNFILTAKSYKFTNSFLFIEESYEGYYLKKLKPGVEAWGGFSHFTEKVHSEFNKIEKILAIENIKIPTKEHLMKIRESIQTTNVFDRFLKKYQMLELMYDYIFIAKLRTIDGGLLDFRKTLSSYSDKEVESLKRLICEYLSDYDKIVNLIYELDNYKSLAIDLFQTSGKDSNPLKDTIHWEKFLTALENRNLSHVNFNSNPEIKIKGWNNEAFFKKKIGEIVAYWIYRIRCSIAHHKIGEFIFGKEHEEFVFKFSEGLIDEILCQVFSNEKFVKLIEDSRSVDLHLADKSQQTSQ